MSRKPDLPNSFNQNPHDQCPQNQNSSAGPEEDPNENLREFHRIYEGIVEESRRQAINWMIMLEREYGNPDDPNLKGKPTKPR